MKISELMIKLEEIKNTRGDLECRIWPSDYDAAGYEPIKTVQVNNSPSLAIANFPHVQIE